MADADPSGGRDPARVEPFGASLPREEPPDGDLS